MFVLMKHSNRFSTVVFMFLLYGCGGGGSTAATPSPGPQTTTFMGSARTTATGGCAALNPAHIISAGDGTMTVTLTQSSAPRMQLQVCSTSEADHRNCTVPPFCSAPGWPKRQRHRKGRALAVGDSVHRRLRCPDRAPDRPHHLLSLGRSPRLVRPRVRPHA